eukprot:TRINITY_DN569_c0_g1_i7.p1 TRINITY_DN569_c0_g1~~TRINITY_DN569_c0_g1_i7.p1  ORF type:complete len:610 (+),score=124.37 TRINITY_DN569_c0_g1_i7:167-1996(+)
MCGIGLIVEAKEIQLPERWKGKEIKGIENEKRKGLDQNKLQSSLTNRGPDHSNSFLQFNTNDKTNDNNNNNDPIHSTKEGREKGLKVFVAASVLSIRGGSIPTVQPLIDSSTGNILLWNGEIFGGIFQPKENENDTQYLMNLLSHSNQSIQQILKQIEGEWAILFWENNKSRWWAGRSYFGQRSLLIHLPNESCSSLSISSLPFDDIIFSTVDNNGKEDEEQESNQVGPWEELVTSSMFSITFDGNNAIVEEHPWDMERINQEEYRPFGSRLNKENLKTELVSQPSISIPSMLLDILMDSVKRRVENLPMPKNGDLHSSKLGILFSGGIDSMVLAAIANLTLPEGESIDLLNVAFGNGNFDVPDRKTGLDGLQELRAISERDWRFVQVNVTPNLVSEHQSQIQKLIYPRQTVMDMTIGAALWFAARGEGRVSDDISNNVYICQSKVLLDGLGADEQLGGYGRHRVSFKNHGKERLEMELDLDIHRLWIRNLGRDDRLISDHGREARFPFLDEKVVKFLHSLPIEEICNFSEPPGTGDKKVLRQVGKLLGLTKSVSLTKRAIQVSLFTTLSIKLNWISLQFGSRVNKVLFPSVPSSKINGSSMFQPTQNG